MATRLRTILVGTTLLAGLAILADSAQAGGSNPFIAAGPTRAGLHMPAAGLGSRLTPGALRGAVRRGRSVLGSRSMPAPRNFGNRPSQQFVLSPRPRMLPSRWLGGIRVIPVFPGAATKPPPFGSTLAFGAGNGAGTARLLPAAPNPNGALQPRFAPAWTPAATAVPVLPGLGNPPRLGGPGLGLTPAERRIAALRDKLGLESPDDVQGQGRLPSRLGESPPGREQGAGGTGGSPSSAGNAGEAGARAGHGADCYSPAQRLDDPQDTAASGSASWRNAQRQLRERDQHSRAARDVVEMARQPGDRNVEHSVRHVPASGDQAPVTIVETRWTGADGSTHFVHEEFAVRRRNEVVSTGFYYSNSRGGPRSAPQTVYYDGRGNEVSRVVRKSEADPTPIIASSDGGNTWELYEDHDDDGRHDGGGSQPVEGAAGDRDYFCETGITNPDGPGGSRRNRKQYTRGSDDRTIPDPSGVIIRPDHVRTPEEIKRMVSQPGVDGAAGGGGGGSGGRRPGDFAQPPAGGPTGDVRPASPQVPGLGLPGRIEEPLIPKPVDPADRG
jgi:hypothetical protein